MRDYLINDFTNPTFQLAFKKYFEELNITVDDWEELFKEMNDDSGNLAFLRLSADEEIVGFIQFKIDILKNWFLEEKYGFIREFWIDVEYRNKGHGANLLNLVENYLIEENIHKSLLTTDTAPNFYIKQGYWKDSSYNAINKCDVFVKTIK
jgi:Acetyltransferase (GNAT) family.